MPLHITSAKILSVNDAKVAEITAAKSLQNTLQFTTALRPFVDLALGVTVLQLQRDTEVTRVGRYTAALSARRSRCQIAFLCPAGSFELGEDPLWKREHGERRG